MRKSGILFQISLFFSIAEKIYAAKENSVPKKPARRLFLFFFRFAHFAQNLQRRAGNAP